MEYETPQPQSVEIDPNLQFITYDSIENVRLQQKMSMDVAEKQATKQSLDEGRYVTSEELKVARESAVTNFDSLMADFLDANVSREDNPDHYNALSELLNKYSFDRMGDAKWRNGDRDAGGNPDFTTSGRYQLEAIVAAIDSREVTEAPSGSPFDHESPEFKAANLALRSTRLAFAKLSVEGRHRSLKNGKKSKAFAAELQNAHDEYQTAQNNIFSMYISGYRAQGHSDDAIGEKLMPAAMVNAIKEQGAFTAAEQEYLMTDKTLRGRATRFLSKRGALFGLSAVSGLAIGTGVRAISKSTAALAVGMTGGAAAGAYFGVRAAKGALLSKLKNGVALHKQVEVRAAKDKAALEARISRISGKSIEDVRNVVGSVGSIALIRVEKDRKTNFRNTAISMALGAGAAALAFELAPEISDIFNGGHDAPQPSGGSGHPPPIAVTPPKPIDTGGFKIDYSVKSGEGYGQVFQDLAKEQGVTVDGYREFLKFAHDHASEKIFSDNNSYTHTGGARISHAGASHFNPNFLAAFHQQLVEEGKIAA